MDNVLFPCYDILLEESTSEKRKQLITEFGKEGLDFNSMTIEPYNAVAFIDHLLRNNIPFERSAIVRLRPFEGIAGPLIFTEDGGADFELDFCTVKNGKIVKKED